MWWVISMVVKDHYRRHVLYRTWELRMLRARRRIKLWYKKLKLLSAVLSKDNRVKLLHIWKDKGVCLSKLAFWLSLMECPKVRCLLFRGDVMWQPPKVGQKIHLNMSWSRRYAIAKYFATKKCQSSEDDDLYDFNITNITLVPVVFITKQKGKILNIPPYCEEEEVVVRKRTFTVYKVTKHGDIYHAYLR